MSLLLYNQLVVCHFCSYSYAASIHALNGVDTNVQQILPVAVLELLVNMLIVVKHLVYLALWRGHELLRVIKALGTQDYTTLQTNFLLLLIRLQYRLESLVSIVCYVQKSFMLLQCSFHVLGWTSTHVDTLLHTTQTLKVASWCTAITSLGRLKDTYKHQ